MGIEPTSSAWEAEVIAIIRRPLTAQCPQILQSDGVTSHGRVVEKCWWPFLVASHVSHETSVYSAADRNPRIIGDFSQVESRVMHRWNMSVSSLLLCLSRSFAFADNKPNIVYILVEN